MMTWKTKALWTIAAAMVLPASSFAADLVWDDTFVWENRNTTPYGGLNGSELLDNAVINSQSADAEFVEGDDNEADSDIPAVQAEAGIDDYAELRLLEAVLADSTKPHHAEIVAAFDANYPIVSRGVQASLLGAIFPAAGTELLTALMIRNQALTVELADGFDVFWSPADLAAMTNVSQYISASGDLDDDGDTLLEEWQDSGSGKAFTHTQGYLDRVNLFITLATAGNTESVDVTPVDSDIFVTQTVQLGAASTDPSDTFTWDSSDDAIATVDSTGLVTGHAAGTVTITATGSNSGAEGEATVTVLSAQWFDLCGYDDQFAQQGAVFAVIGAQLGLPFPTWEDFDLDLDGVSDAWQAHHVAWALCEGPAQVATDYNTNLSEISSLITELDALVTFLDDADDDMNAFLTALGADGTCTNPTVINNATLEATYGAVFGATPIHLAFGAIASQATNAVDDFEDIPTGLLAIREVLASIVGQSTEAGIAINSLVPYSDIALLRQALQLLANVAGDLAGNCLSGNATLAPQAGQLAALLIGAPGVTTPSFVVYDAGSKAANEDFAGAGDYDQDGVNNGQIAGFVEGASGDEDDYVAGVTGELGPFWTGNPNLPAAGLVGLGAILSALSATGAFALRRKK